MDSDAAVQASQLPITAAQLMQQFLGTDFGDTTTGKNVASSTGGTVNTVNTSENGTTGTTGEATTDRTIDTKEKGTKNGVGFKAGI